MTRPPPLQLFWFLSIATLCAVAQSPPPMPPPPASLNRSNTHTESLTDDQFVGHDSLVYLYLVGNGIEAVDEHAFARLESLSHLNLSYNAIRALHADTFAENRALRTLSLRGNPLETLDRVAVVTSASVTTLDLSRCNVTRVFPATLSGVPLLDTLDLSFNRLQHVSDADFRPVPLLGSVSLRENPWRCCREGEKAFMVAAAVRDADELRCLLETEELTLWSLVGAFDCGRRATSSEVTDVTVTTETEKESEEIDAARGTGDVLSTVTGTDSNDVILNNAVTSPATETQAAEIDATSEPGSISEITDRPVDIVMQRISDEDRAIVRPHPKTSAGATVAADLANTTTDVNVTHVPNAEEEKTWNIIMTIVAMGGVVFLGVLLAVLWMCGKRKFRSAENNKEETEDTELYYRVPQDDDYYK